MKIETDRAVDIADDGTTWAPPYADATPTTHDDADTDNVAAPLEPQRAVSVRTVRTSHISASVVMAGLAAIALLVLGGVTVARAGLGGELARPVVDVAGFTATAILGFAEVGLGLALLLAAVARNRRAALLIAVVGGVAALVAVIQPSVGRDQLAIERGLAVWVAIGMAVVAISALLPTLRRQSTVRTHRSD